MDITLPNGHVIKGVPEGTSKEDVKKKAIASGVATAADFEKKKPAEEVSKLESAVRGGAQGLTLGWGDEIMGQVAEDWINVTGNQGLFDDPYAKARAEQGMSTTAEDIYTKARDEFRAENQAAREANPWTYGASQLAGSVAPAVLTAGGSTPVQIGAAGVYGGTYGAGESTEDTAAGVAEDAAWGAGTTMATMGLLKGIPKVVRGGKGLLDKTGKALTDKLPPALAKYAPSGSDASVTALGFATGGPFGALGSYLTKKAIESATKKAGNSALLNKMSKHTGQHVTVGQNSKYLTGLLQAIHDDSVSP